MFKSTVCTERSLKFIAHAALYSLVLASTGLLLWYYITESNAMIETADRAIDELEATKATIIDDQIKRNYRRMFVGTTYRIALEAQSLTNIIDRSNQTVMEEISKLANTSDPNSLQCFKKTSIYNRKYFEIIIKFKECCVSNQIKLLDNGLQGMLSKAIRQVEEIFNGLKREYDVCKKAVLKDCLNNVIKTVDVAKSEFVQISNGFSNEISNYGKTFNLNDVEFITATLKDFADNLREFMEICINSIQY